MQKITPDKIEKLAENEVFVFGSNLAGRHEGGAARAALDKFGAIWGQGNGFQGQSYAIPTMQGGVKTIKLYVDEFIRFAKAHPEKIFLVTRIGCGIAGFKDEEIAPLFIGAVNENNIALPATFLMLLSSPSVPKHILSKVHGQTATLVDMLIELNKENGFTSAEEALNCLGEYLYHLRTDGDIVAFNCSIRSLWSCCNECFPNGKLDIALLRQNLNHLPNSGINKVYGEYVIDKTVKLIEIMNEFRRYTNPQDIAEDLVTATGGVNDCGPQSCNYYFGFRSPSGCNHLFIIFSNYLNQFWNEFAPTGVLNNKLFRDFMIERHQRGIEKYGLDAVIKRNYEQDGICHPEVYWPYRGGAGPVYVKDEEKRKWIKSCGEGKGPNRFPNYYENHLITKVLATDTRYCLKQKDKWESCYVPKHDYSLPIYSTWSGKLDFVSMEEKLKWIRECDN